jgi:hypothetical protein
MLPWALSYPELVGRARQRLASDPETRGSLETADRERDEEILCEVLLACYRADLLRWQLDPPCWAPTVSERPAVNALTRLQLQEGVENVFTLNHGLMKIDRPFDRHVLLQADGGRTVDEIVDGVESSLKAGRIVTPTSPPDGAGRGEEPIDSRTAVERILASAAKYGLLSA